MAIELYKEELVPAVKKFNSRLDASGAPSPLRAPESPIPTWLPRVNDRRIYQEYFLCYGDGAVRGFYKLKHQDFSLRGEICSLGFFHYPVSEGLIDKKFAWVAIQMLGTAIKAKPLIYGLGMVEPFVGMVKALGWSISSVPFFFRVNRPRRFLREMQFLRKTAARGFMMDLAAATGTGGLALRVLHRARTKRRRLLERIEPFHGFGKWADELWKACQGRYGMIAVRDRETLNILYPSGSERFLCFKVWQEERLLGWVILLDTTMQGNKYFGNMRVGSIVDGLGLPADASALVRAATQVLEEREVDLIVSNQAHTSWCAGFREAGYLAGPSNYLFGQSKELAKLVQSHRIGLSEIHLTRGDGDGPTHL